MFSGSRLKECRMEKYYSQSELANLLKINRASYNKWETGKSVPNRGPERLRGICIDKK